MTRGEQISGIRISYSSSNTFLGCQRRFYYQKVKKVDFDPDFEDNAKALRIGKAYHSVLEYCKHSKMAILPEHYRQSFEENAVSSPTEQGMIAAMVRKYLSLHARTKLIVVGIEIKVGNEVDYIGFIDVVLADMNGNWWICDLKTAAKLNASLLSKLSRDPQLNIYSYFADEVAEKCGLDLKKFQGVRYRVTTKCAIKCNNKESIKEFSKRCFDRVESYDIAVPKKDLDPAKVHTRFMELLKEMRSLEGKPEEKVPQNFTYCESFFKPCPYWSRCYGKTYTTNAEQYEIFDTDNIPDLTVEESQPSFGEDDDLEFL
jgi:hypothetical protein